MQHAAPYKSVFLGVTTSPHRGETPGAPDGDMGLIQIHIHVEVVGDEGP